MPVDWSVLLDPVTVAAGLIGIGVAVATCILSWMQRRDAWFSTYEKLHGDFWSAPDMAQVRSMVANPHAFPKLQRALQARKDRHDDSRKRPLSRQESALVDQLDTYLHLLLRLSLVRRVGAHKTIWRALVRQYWLRALAAPEREPLGWYVWHFYPHYGQVDRRLRRHLVDRHGAFPNENARASAVAGCSTCSVPTEPTAK